MQTINTEAVADHYSPGHLLASIEQGILDSGKTTAQVTLGDLAVVDEFHVGGRAATKALLDPLNLSADSKVLDIGCGLGGSARFMADEYGCHCTGMDLTAEFIEAGSAMCEWVGLDQQVKLLQGNALDTGLNSESFDAVSLLHVGMNIADKKTLFAEAYRLLRPGGSIAIYDVVRLQDSAFAYPVPWATSSSTCAAAKPQAYLEALDAAGFLLVSQRERMDVAEAFFTKLQNNAAAGKGPPPLGLHLVMGKTTPDKVANLVKNVSNGLAVPVEMIARKA